MMRLIRDRYLAWNDSRVLDLATGLAGDSRLIPDDTEADPPLQALIEVLEHGREGEPRWVVAGPEGSPGIDRLVRRAARDASARGFVPVGVEVYLRLRAELSELLRDRSLLLIDRAGPPARRARFALLDAAAMSPRPHVLLTLPAASGPARLAREARARYGPAPVRVRQLPPIDADVEHHLRRASRAEAFIRAGRHAAAERLLRDVAGALARRGRMALYARVSIDLGRTILERGRAADADRVFEAAAAAAATVEDEGLVADSRLWQAVSRTDAARLTDAEALCRAVLAGCRLENGRRAWARATLARVLLWQRRAGDAFDLDLSLPDDHGLDATTASLVGAAEVRVLLAAGRVFDAGLCAGRLADRARGSTPGACGAAALAQLRFFVAAGAMDLAMAAVQTVVALAKEAGAPLGAVRARAVWASGLLKAGRAAEARVEIARLARWCRAAPPLLRRAVHELAVEAERGPTPRGTSAAAIRMLDRSPAVAMIVAAQDEDGDGDAVRRVLQVASDSLAACRIDVCSAEAGPVSTMASVGSGLPTHLGARVLETGLTIGPETHGAGSEIGVPVRRGTCLGAAMVARWPADRQPPAHARDVLETAAAVAGPRVEALLAAARVPLAPATPVPELIGVSAAIDTVRTAIARAAAAPFPVLVLGESGVGKELAARAIHRIGPRRERRFCDLNCAALPDELIESELFGHARGAFTGAISDRHGIFEEADGGTVFLDELADLSARAQAKLLRVLQQQEVRRVGETFSRRVDVRVVAAANRDMEAEAASGRFRQDLLYRLDVIRIRMPPLRERPEDVAVLAQHFWQSASERVGTTARLAHGVLSALTRYHWPGNVRELQNVMAALAVAAPARGLVRAPLLPAAIAGAAPVTAARLADARAQFERRAIESALARAGGSRTRAARELGLSRQGLLKMMSRLQLAKGA